jgi:hypothetical protein
MKKFLLGSLVLLMFSASIILFNASCNKDSDAQPNSNSSNCIGPQPTLQFKGNGVLYVCKGVNDSRVGWSGYPVIWRGNDSRPFYRLDFCNYKQTVDYSGQYNVNFPITSNTVGGFIAMSTANLSIGTYTSADDAIRFDNLDHEYEANDGRITINITSIKDGLASGTFSGNLPATGTGNFNRGPQMNITEGVFTSIPVFE